MSIEHVAPDKSLNAKAPHRDAIQHYSFQEDSTDSTLTCSVYEEATVDTRHPFKHKRRHPKTASSRSSADFDAGLNQLGQHPSS